MNSCRVNKPDSPTSAGVRRIVNYIFGFEAYSVITISLNGTHAGHPQVYHIDNIFGI